MGSVARAGLRVKGTQGVALAGHSHMLAGEQGSEAMAIRKVQEAIVELQRPRDEWAAFLAKLEADGHGNTDLAWRMRDFVNAVDRLSASVADQVT
jgi:hypothetical protein